MSQTIPIFSSLPNDIGGLLVGVVTWLPNAVSITITLPSGETSLATLGVGQPFPFLDGIVVLDILPPPRLPPYEVSKKVGPRRSVMFLCRVEDYSTLTIHNDPSLTDRDRWTRRLEIWAAHNPAPGSNAYAAIEQGGDPSEAMAWVAGMKPHSATLTELGIPGIYQLLRARVPLVAASGLFTQEHPGWQLAQQRRIYFDMAYSVKDAGPDGRIQLMNPWQFGHPEDLPIEVLMVLFTSFYRVED